MNKEQYERPEKHSYVVPAQPSPQDSLPAHREDFLRVWRRGWKRRWLMSPLLSWTQVSGKYRVWRFVSRAKKNQKKHCWCIQRQKRRLYSTTSYENMLEMWHHVLIWALSLMLLDSNFIIPNVWSRPLSLYRFECSVSSLTQDCTCEILYILRPAATEKADDRKRSIFSNSVSPCSLLVMFCWVGFIKGDSRVQINLHFTWCKRTKMDFPVEINVA